LLPFQQQSTISPVNKHPGNIFIQVDGGEENTKRVHALCEFRLQQISQKGGDVTKLPVGN